MTTQEFFLSPHSSFYYVKDSIVWENLFSAPVPKDYEHPELGKLFLTDFFIIKDIYVEIQNFVGTRKFLTCKPDFYNISSEERNTVFLALAEFLIKFGKNFLAIYIYIPNHEEVEIREDFLPLPIFYDTPEPLRISEDKQGFLIKLEESLFAELCKYIFNEEPKKEDGTSIHFLPMCFGGGIF